MTAAFTGFAYTDCNETSPVSRWITDTLRCQVDTASAVDALMLGATKIVFDLAPYWEKRKLSIVLAGIPPESGVAYCARISNFERGGDKLRKQVDHFMVEQILMPLSEGNIHYMVSGVSLKADEFQRVRDTLPELVANRTVEDMKRFLVKTQRRVSARTPVVGQDAMVMIIPANPTAPGAIPTNTLSDEVMDVNANFSYVRAHTFSQQRIAPLAAGGGNVIEMIGWGDASGAQSVRAKFVKLGRPDEAPN
jgi:hypothetical protein